MYGAFLSSPTCASAGSTTSAVETVVVIWVMWCDVAETDHHISFHTACTFMQLRRVIVAGVSKPTNPRRVQSLRIKEEAQTLSESFQAHEQFANMKWH